MLGKPKFVCNASIMVDGELKDYGFLTTDCENPEQKADWILAELRRDGKSGKLISVTIKPREKVHSKPRGKRSRK